MAPNPTRIYGCKSVTLEDFSVTRTDLNETDPQKLLEVDRFINYSKSIDKLGISMPCKTLQ